MLPPAAVTFALKAAARAALSPGTPPKVAKVEEEEGDVPSGMTVQG
jgi:hypothetical protein